MMLRNSRTLMAVRSVRRQVLYLHSAKHRLLKSSPKRAHTIASSSPTGSPVLAPNNTTRPPVAPIAPQSPSERLGAKKKSSKGLSAHSRAKRGAKMLVLNRPADDPDLTPRKILFSLNRNLIALDVVFLRDSCSCSLCVDPLTQQKLFDTASIPFGIGATVSEPKSDGGFQLTWHNDVPGFKNHISTYPPTFISKNSTSRSSQVAHRPRHSHTLWDGKAMERDKLTIDYASYMKSSSVLHKALDSLQQYGLLFLSSVPSDSESISRIASRIGPLRNTLYGSTWDVKSVPNAKNIAYKSSNLGFHMDLLYHRTPPKLQMLHCMKHSTRGGESLFSDTFRAIDDMMSTEGDLLEPLTKYGLLYQYKNDGHWYYYTRNTVEMTRRPHTYLVSTVDGTRTKIGKMASAINWSPPFQGPLLGIEEATPRSSQLRSYLKAAKVFKNLIEDKSAVFETKLEEGMCVLFDNRRLVHARKAFDNEGGERWLRGAYVDDDPFQSRLRVLDEEYGRLSDIPLGNLPPVT